MKRKTLRTIGAAAVAVTVGMFAWTGAAGAAGGGAHWGYTGEHGPEHWGELSHEYEACGKGTKQSPIDIEAAREANLDDIAFHYGSSKVDIVNNGHTVKVSYDEGSYVEVDGERYDLLQLHFHTPSEHAVSGELAPMEMHLVHSNSDGKLAVVGVMFEEGEENEAFDPVWLNLPEESGDHYETDDTVNAEDLLPEDRTYYTYTGSLTTPPCTEGVKWMVLTDTVELSADQVDEIHEIMHSNNRPVQPLNERVVVEDTE